MNTLNRLTNLNKLSGWGLGWFVWSQLFVSDVHELLVGRGLLLLGGDGLVQVGLEGLYNIM